MNRFRFSIDRLTGLDLACILVAVFAWSMAAAMLTSAAGQL